MPGFARRAFLTSLLSGTACTVAGPALTAPIFDPRAFRAKVKGGLTEILVLGTAHLSAFPDITADTVEPVLARLEKWKPDLITIEALSGESLDILTTYAPIYPDVAATYGKRILTLAEPAAVASGLTRPQAALKARDMLAEWPASATAQDHRRLCLLFAAAGDAFSALVQWLRLAPADRIAADGLTADMLPLLDALAAQKNENTLVAARLAARLGLEQVWPVDDHTADDAGDNLPKALKDEAGIDIGAADAGADHSYSKAYRALSAKVKTPEDMLAMYRFLNAPENMLADASGQWLPMMAHDSPRHLARVYNSWWETRNLRMVANIREAIAAYPGKRVLVIVGASHKPYFEAYLDLMPEVHIVDSLSLLNL